MAWRFKLYPREMHHVDTNCREGAKAGTLEFESKSYIP